MKKISLLLLQIFVGFLQSAENQLALLSLNMEFLSEDELKKDLFTGIVNNKVSHVVSSVTQLKKINPRVLQDESFLHPNGYSPLAYAVLKAADESIIKYLLEQGASPLVMTKIKLEDNREEFASLMDILFEKTAFALLKQSRKNKVDYINRISKLLLYYEVPYRRDIIEKVKKSWLGDRLEANFYEDEEPPLISAINQQDSSKVDELLKKGAIVEAKKDYWPLMTAIQSGNMAIIKMLLDSGANVNDKNQFGPPLLYALGERDLVLAKLLIDYGADVNYVKNKIGESYLMGLLNSYRLDSTKNDMPLIHLLLQNNSNILAVDTNGNNVLHYGLGAIGIHVGDVLPYDVLRYIIEAVPFCVISKLFNGKNLWEETPLVIACLDHIVELVELGISKGGNIRWSDRNGNTLFMRLLSRSSYSSRRDKKSFISIIDIVLREGTDIFAVNSDGSNVLHCMCKNEWLPIEIFTYVLDKIACSTIYNINRNAIKKLMSARDKHQQTPLDILKRENKRENKLELIEVLERFQNK